MVKNGFHSFHDDGYFMNLTEFVNIKIGGVHAKVIILGM
jgi:hypothetical protein